MWGVGVLGFWDWTQLTSPLADGSYFPVREIIRSRVATSAKS